MRGVARTPAIGRALHLEPSFEVGRIRQEKTFQQVAAVVLERLLQVTSVERMLELGDVASHLFGDNPDLLLPMTVYHVAQRAPDDVQRLAQCVAGVVVVKLGPEEGQERIAARLGVASLNGEVREESQTLGTAEQ